MNAMCISGPLNSIYHERANLQYISSILKGGSFYSNNENWTILRNADKWFDE